MALSLSFALACLVVLVALSLSHSLWPALLQILTTITQDILGYAGQFRSPADQAAFIADLYTRASSTARVCVYLWEDGCVNESVSGCVCERECVYMSHIQSPTHTHTHVQAGRVTLRAASRL